MVGPQRTPYNLNWSDLVGGGDDQGFITPSKGGVLASDSEKGFPSALCGDDHGPSIWFLLVVLVMACDDVVVCGVWCVWACM